MTTKEQREHLSAHHPDVLALVENGWTIDAAFSHVDGTCDRELCTGEHDDSAPWWTR